MPRNKISPEILALQAKSATLSDWTSDLPLFLLALAFAGLILTGDPALSSAVLRPYCSPRDDFACRDLSLAWTVASSSWKFTRAQGSKEGESFAAIMKTADTAQSDPDFAGLIVRCAPKGKIELLVALIRPFTPRSRPQVTIAAGAASQTFEASMAAAGAAVLLPDEVAALAGGQWQTTPSLTLTVKENISEIKGTVILNGLREAYASLQASCSQ